MTTVSCLAGKHLSCWRLPGGLLPETTTSSISQAYRVTGLRKMCSRFLTGCATGVWQIAHPVANERAGLIPAP